MAFENGDVVKIWVTDSTTNAALAGQLSSSLSYSADYIETSAKGNSHRVGIVGRKSITISAEGRYDHSDTATQDLITIMEATTAAEVTVAIYRSSVSYKSGTGIVTALEVTHPDNEAAGWSATIELDGNLS